MSYLADSQHPIEPAVARGAAVYGRAALAAYDAFVVGFSNTFAWKCPSPVLLEFYNQNVSREHLDVGVGTGYFLDKCRFPTPSPNITLVDLNPNCLRVAAKRLRRNHPGYDLAGCHLANVLEPVELGAAKFGSIAINYLLHCLPGSMTGAVGADNKGVVFANLKRCLQSGGVLFGATIVGAGVEHGFLARRLMDVYNAKGVFSNTSDSVAGLGAELQKHFEESSVQLLGSVALFSAQGARPA
jgi:hypothetical protein